MDPHEFFDQIDVLVVPSLWAEPFGRIVIEAYSAGVPVLAARSGGLPELIAGDKDAWLLPPGDVPALAARMSDLIVGGRGALPSPEIFADNLARTSPEAVEAQYGALYDDLLAQPPATAGR